MRSERDFDGALEAIAGGASIRGCGLPKSTILSRAERDARFARRLAAAQQTGRLHLRSAPHASGGQLTRDELWAILAEQARQGRGWAVKLAFELLGSNSVGSRVPARFLEAVERADW